MEGFYAKYLKEVEIVYSIKFQKPFFSLIKRIFQSIKNGQIPVPFNLNRALLDKVIRAKNSEKAIIQNGSGIVSILAAVVLALVTLVPEIVKLFKKKKTTE